MENSNSTPTQNIEKKSIIKAIGIAFICGMALLIVAVLPAEYGIDPIGTGKLFGFSKLYVPDEDDNNLQAMVSNTNIPLVKIEKVGSGPNVPRPVEADYPAPDKQLPIREDQTEVIVPAGKGIEFKINVLKYGTVKYEWTTQNRELLYFDFHGEVKQKVKPKQTYYDSYTIANANNMVGSMLAPFEGSHGWYFKNNTEQDIVVNLKLKGQYTL